MNASKNPLLIGVIAGLASALMLALGSAAPRFSMILACLSLTALFTAGLGWGLLSSIVAVAVAAASTALLDHSLYAFAVSLLAILPAVVMSYLANLARPAKEIGGPETALAWYPLSDVLLAGAVLVAIATMATALMTPDLEMLYSALVEAIVQLMMEIDSRVVVSEAFKQNLVPFLRIIWPMAQSMQLMLALFAGFYFAMRLLSSFGKNIRPREDMTTSLRMNRLAIAVFFAGLALIFVGGLTGLGGLPSLIGAAFAGSAAGGFLLAGFAIIHNAVKGKSWGLPVLIIIYLLSIFFLPLIAMGVIIIGGIANPRRAVALTPDKSKNPANQN